MPFPELALALVVLLLTPGPTNTLMAVAGGERGPRGALALIPLELAAYLCMVLPLAIAGSGLLGAVPALKPVITGIAACWVLWLALRMWRIPPLGAEGPAAVTVTGRRVFVTTFLNPKALIIGLVLLPGGPLLPRTLLFAALVVSAATAWIWLGAALARGGNRGAPGLPPLLRRAAALWLAGLSATLAFSAVHAQI